MTPWLPSSNAQYTDYGRERRVCAACKEPHSFYSCYKYLDMDSAARRPFAAQHRVCFKCANSVSHGWRQCTQVHLKCFWCYSTNHHSTLHVDNDNSSEPFTDARLWGGPYMMGSSTTDTTSTSGLSGAPATSTAPSTSSS